MYNALVLISLLPFSGPDAGRYVASLPPSSTIQVASTEGHDTLDTATVGRSSLNSLTNSVKAADKVPVLPGEPVRVTVARQTGAPPKAQPPAALPEPKSWKDATPVPFKPIEVAPEAEQPKPVAAKSKPPVSPQPLPPNPEPTPTPVPAPEPIASAPTQVPSTFDQRNPNVIETNGMLEVPKRHDVIVSAPSAAILMSLTTEKRNAQGEVETDASGNPVMVPITEGMNVVEGQLLGNLDDRELNSMLQSAQARLDVANAEMNKKIEIEYANTGVYVSKAEWAMLSEAN